ncbi:cation:proton antiporter [Yinghuangia seranimata]|uniref:cation:proton antiporter n=1 Tax=Yinghuangia seranimata TaxID=408067 RepID=UPI00248AA0CB|nr:cation:proton antiporter [Yinghuangia seranimata]MDI2132427.1 cation:proton antiporter [Yinghuangia seranimata]
MTALALAPVSPLGSHALQIFLLQVGLLLTFATALGRLAVRFGWPAVAGELCAGVLLGPSVLRHLAPGASDWLFPRQPDQFHLLDAVGQLSVILLVGMTGMQMDLGMVRRCGRVAAYVSVGGLVVPLVFGVSAGLFLPDSFVVEGTDRAVFAAFLGVALCVSAIPVIAKTLMDMDLFHRDVGQLTLAAAIVDDIVGWLLLSVVSAAATAGFSGERIALSALSLIAVVVVARLVVRPLARKALRGGDGAAEHGTTVAAIVALVLLAAAGAQALELEPVFGAFMCGMALVSSGALSPRHLAPLRTLVLGVLAPLFFAAAGLRIDLSALRSPQVLVVALLVLSLAVAGKFAGAYLGARLGRLGRREAVALGAGLNARGVVEIVIATVGLRINVLTPEMYTIIVLTALVTSLIAPPVLRRAMRRIEPTQEEADRARALGVRPAAGDQPAADPSATVEA